MTNTTQPPADGVNVGAFLERLTRAGLEAVELPRPFTRAELTHGVVVVIEDAGPEAILCRDEQGDLRSLVASQLLRELRKASAGDKFAILRVGEGRSASGRVYGKYKVWGLA